MNFLISFLESSSKVGLINFKRFILMFPFPLKSIISSVKQGSALNFAFGNVLLINNETIQIYPIYLTVSE